MSKLNKYDVHALEKMLSDNIRIANRIVENSGLRNALSVSNQFDESFQRIRDTVVTIDTSAFSNQIRSMNDMLVTSYNLSEPTRNLISMWTKTNQEAISSSIRQMSGINQQYIKQLNSMPPETLDLLKSIAKIQSSFDTSAFNSDWVREVGTRKMFSDFNKFDEQVELEKNPRYREILTGIKVYLLKVKPAEAIVDLIILLALASSLYQYAVFYQSDSKELIDYLMNLINVLDLLILKSQYKNDKNE